MEKKEFIGKSAKMFAFNTEFSGKIVDETMHMIRIEDKNGRIVSLPKKVSRLEIKIDDYSTDSIDGSNVEYRSWERTEKAGKKKGVTTKK